LAQPSGSGGHVGGPIGGDSGTSESPLPATTVDGDMDSKGEDVMESSEEGKVKFPS